MEIRMRLAHPKERAFNNQRIPACAGMLKSCFCCCRIYAMLADFFFLAFFFSLDLTKRDSLPPHQGQTPWMVWRIFFKLRGVDF